MTETRTNTNTGTSTIVLLYTHNDEPFSFVSITLPVTPSLRFFTFSQHAGLIPHPLSHIMNSSDEQDTHTQGILYSLNKHAPPSPFVPHRMTRTPGALGRPGFSLLCGAEASERKQGGQEAASTDGGASVKLPFEGETKSGAR